MSSAFNGLTEAKRRRLVARYHPGNYLMLQNGHPFTADLQRECEDIQRWLENHIDTMKQENAEPGPDRYRVPPRARRLRRPWTLQRASVIELIN